MAYRIETRIHIAASAKTVWQVLTDFAAYPSWNNFVKELQGDVAVGKRIRVQLPGMVFTPLVVAFEAPHRFAWLGHLWVAGLFDGRHAFEVIAHPDNTCTFIHSEDFDGILVPLFKKMLITQTQPGFEEMNKRLKTRVELLQQSQNLI